MKEAGNEKGKICGRNSYEFLQTCVTFLPRHTDYTSDSLAGKHDHVMANGCEQKLYAPLWSIEASAGRSPFFFFQLLAKCPSRGTEPGSLDNCKGRSLKGQAHLHRL